MGRLKLDGGLDVEYVGDDGKGYLNPLDEKLLCRVACQCSLKPEIAINGNEQKQNCMEKTLDTINKIDPHNAYYKPEVSYDMTKKPPRPILESNPKPGVAAQKHPSWLGWLKKHWDDPEAGRPKFERNTGQIRRPDIVIVYDPMESPVQENIRQIVEVKFPGDFLKDGQERDYSRIAGSRKKLVVLEVGSCGCDSPERQPILSPDTVKVQASSIANDGYIDDSRAYEDAQGILNVEASPIDDDTPYNTGSYFRLSPKDQQLLSESATVALAGAVVMAATSAWLAALL